MCESETDSTECLLNNEFARLWKIERETSLCERKGFEKSIFHSFG